MTCPTENVKKFKCLVTTDKNDRPIHKGDIVKFLYATGGHNKKYYMYKLCLGETEILSLTGEYIRYIIFGHISIHHDVHKHTSKEEVGQKLEDYEIVQECSGSVYFEKRGRYYPPKAEGEK